MHGTDTYIHMVTCTAMVGGASLCRVSNVVEAHGYGFRSTVVSGEHSRRKTSAIIAMFRRQGSSSGAKLFCT